jgi:TP901 family phage tail tape measure protein
MAIFIPLVTKFDSKGLDGAKRALANFQNFAVDVGRIAATAIAAVGVASVREAMQFETSIAKVEGLVGVAGKELDEMAAAARRLGVETGKGAQEAANALFVIASSGLRGSNAIDALELSLKASVAGLGDTESIARSVSGALNAYGTDVLSAAQATDVIVATARAGNFETEQFAGAIGRVLPFAVQAGSSLEDMGGAVALLTRTNTDAAQSVTQVAALFKAFVVPTEEAKKALQNVGLSAEDMRNAIANEGLPAALDMLDQKLGGNREQLGRLLGSSEAASAAFQILNADSNTIAETFGAVSEASGITQEAFEVMQDTTENKFAVAMAKARDSLIEIGDAILDDLEPHLNNFIDWMTEHGPAIEEGFIKIFDAINKFLTSEVLADIIQKFKDMWPEIKEVVFQLGEMVAVLAPVLLDAVNDILPLFKDLASTVSDLGSFIDEVLGYFGEWEGETPSFVEFLEKTINPMLALKEAAKGAAQTMNAALEAIRRLKSEGLNLLEGGAIPGQFGGRRAGGGPVSSGRGYLVGEMGPELFIPSSGGGTIIPNDRVGGGANINITVNAGMGANGAQIGEQIVTAIKRYERTSGPVFASA